MRLHSRLPLLLVVPLLAVIGCTALPGGASPTDSTPTATASEQASPSAPTSMAAMPLPTVVTTPRTLGDPHITLSPPGDVVPKITSEAAYALCLSGVAGCLPGPPTMIELARVTDTAYGTTSSAGKTTLLLTDTLVWAISWIGSSECVFSGGGPAPVASAPQPSAPQSQPLCDSITFVNATTGAFIFNVAYGHQ